MPCVRSASAPARALQRPAVGEHGRGLSWTMRRDGSEVVDHSFEDAGLRPPLRLLVDGFPEAADRAPPRSRTRYRAA
jgi:hypothetical protein